MLKYKIFFWLLIHDRINTRNLLKRKNFHIPSYSRVLCSLETEETAKHLMWDCPFSLGCWDSITPHRARGISIQDEIMNNIEVMPTGIAMEITIMAAWNIWMQRNDHIFHHKSFSITKWRRRLKKDLILMDHRIKDKHKSTLQAWISNFLN